MEIASPGLSPFAYSTIVTLLIVYYVGALVSLIHLIFKSDYNLKERLLWMLALWLLPIVGLAAYWVFWRRRTARQ